MAKFTSKGILMFIGIVVSLGFVASCASVPPAFDDALIGKWVYKGSTPVQPTLQNIEFRGDGTMIMGNPGSSGSMNVKYQAAKVL